MSQDWTPAPDGRNAGTEPEAQTTSLGLPDLGGSPDRSLEAEDRAAINALPVGSALLVAHAGPNQGPGSCWTRTPPPPAATRTRTSSSTM